MNLANIKIGAFYAYYKAPDGTKYKLPAKDDVQASWVSITKEEYEHEDVAPTHTSVSTVVAGNQSGDSGRVSGDTTQEAHIGSGSLVPVDLVAGVTDSFGPADFQLMLKQLDELVGEQTSISQLQLDMARKYVSEVMMTLKEYPEFEPILIDKDVHNVMMFVQSSMNLATADFVTKKQKKETAATRKAAKSGTMTFSMIAFESEEVKGGMDFGAAFGGSAFDLGSMNLDDVKPKNRGEK